MNGSVDILRKTDTNYHHVTQSLAPRLPTVEWTFAGKTTIAKSDFAKSALPKVTS